MVSKKGEGLSLNFIIVAILALITLIVIALFFTGGITKLFGTQKDVAKVSLDPQIRALAESTCNLHCVNQDEVAFNNPSLPKDLQDAGYVTCADVLNKEFSACKVVKSCQKVDLTSAADCAQPTELACNSVSGCSWQ